MKDEFEEYVRAHPAVNTIERIDLDHDYMLQVVFSDIDELKRFLDDIERFGIERKYVYHIIEEVAKERVLTKANEK